MNTQTKNILRIGGFGSKIDMIELGICPICCTSINIQFMEESQQIVYKNTGLCTECQKKV